MEADGGRASRQAGVVARSVSVSIRPKACACGSFVVRVEKGDGRDVHEPSRRQGID